MKQKIIASVTIFICDIKTSDRQECNRRFLQVIETLKIKIFVRFGETKYKLSFIVTISV